jgi:hypothetical protein
MLINGFLVLTVTLIPFSTALLAGHLGHAGSADAVIFYNGSLLLVAVIFQLFWLSGTKNGRLLGADYDQLEIKRITRQFNLELCFMLPHFSFPFFQGSV